MLAYSAIVVLLRPDLGTIHTLFEGHLTFIERLVRQLAESEHEASADHVGTLLSHSVMVDRSIPETPQRPTG